MMEITRTTVEEYAARYDKLASESDRTIEAKIKQILTTQRFLTKAQFVETGVWKSPRARKWYEANDEEAVKEITAFCFSAKTEQARVGSLFALTGVSYPLASVILHFAFPERYPILDFRALWSLGWEQPSNYTLEFWNRYCVRLRELALQLGVPLRTLDKALWQYSSDHQKARTAAT